MEKKSPQNKEKGKKKCRGIEGKGRVCLTTQLWNVFPHFLGIPLWCIDIYRESITARHFSLYLENMLKNISSNEKENVFKCSRTNYGGGGV